MKRHSLILLLILSVTAVSAGEETPMLKKAESSDSPVAVKEMEAMVTFVLPVTGSYEQHDDAIGKLMAEVEKSGITPVGGPFGRYFNNPMEVGPEDLSWEVGVPIAESIEVEEPFKCSTIPAGLVAFALHVGPYEQSAMMYPVIFAWMAANGYRMAGPPMEFWMGDPEGEGDKGPRSELCLPVTKIEK